VRVSNAPLGVLPSGVVAGTNASFTKEVTAAPSPKLEIPVGGKGRYVIIQSNLKANYLSLAEVEVIGSTR